MLADEGSLSCPAIMVAAPGNHQGRTSVTAALARYHRSQGRSVQVFKAGPDFFDPLIYQLASGLSVDNIDLWMVGEARCRFLLHRAAQEVDLIILECPVGLYDTQSSCVDIAQLFKIPLVVVVDGSKGIASAENYIDDLVTLEPDYPLLGVLVNKVDADFEPLAIQQRLRAGVGYLGHIPHDPAMTFVDQGFKVLQPELQAQMEAMLDQSAGFIAQTQLASLPASVTFYPAAHPSLPKLLDGIKVGIARDEAFAYIYPANVELLQEMGAEVEYFSPLHDVAVPDVDSIWLPGGFPELYLEQLSQNRTMKTSIRDFQNSGGHILAECGGMMYLLGSLVDKHGVETEMVGLLPGKVKFLNHVSALGHQLVNIDDQSIRGHLFHSSRMESDMEPVKIHERVPGKRPAETLFRMNHLTASFVHFYLPSNPLLTAKFFGSPIFTGT